MSLYLGGDIVTAEDGTAEDVTDDGDEDGTEGVDVR
jgi:hypothetical protein